MNTRARTGVRRSQLFVKHKFEQQILVKINRTVCVKLLTSLIAKR